MMKIFVSYRRADSRQATGRICDKLVARYGADNVFMDVDSIALGSDFRNVIHESVAGCDILVAVIGRQWAVDASGRWRLEDPSDFVRIELESALWRNIRIIPLLVEQAVFPAVNELPESLEELAFRNATAIRPDPDFHRDMDRVIESIGPILRYPGGLEEPVEHNRSLADLHYYLYVSRTKVEMLSAQISSESRRKPDENGNVYQALGSVIRHLDQKGLIGVCDQPLTYFRGVMDMHFGDVSFYRGGGRMVLFSGMTEKGTLVGLVGSTAYVIGAPSMETESLGYARPEFWLEIIESLTPPSPDSFGKQMYDLDNMVHHQAKSRQDAPKQKVEFVAKQFVALETKWFEDSRDGLPCVRQFVIGSPLFVATAN